MIDYARTFGLPAVVFRMSCIYGPHQCGSEDQGWVAHFVIQALKGRPITLFGDGGQVRDVLYVEDLVDAFRLAISNVDALKGNAFNMGGGPENTISLLEFLDTIEALHGERPDVAFDAWRPGDQRYYVSDTSKFRIATGWSPRYSARRGIETLYGWLDKSRVPEMVPLGARNERKGEPWGRGEAMRAARVAEPGRIDIQEVETPEPGTGEIRVRLEGCGVCASNIPPWEGARMVLVPDGAGRTRSRGMGPDRQGRFQRRGFRRGRSSRLPLEPRLRGVRRRPAGLGGRAAPDARRRAFSPASRWAAR